MVSKHRLVGGCGFAVGAVRQEGIVAVGPQMRVERVAPLLGAGLHDGAPAALEASLEQAGQRVLQRRFGQVVEQDLGHGQSGCGQPS